MSVEYGILQTGTLSTNTSNYEAGYVFTANEKLFFHGFRIYPYAATTNVVCTLWDAETKAAIAQVSVASVTTQTWTEFYLDAPIKLQKGKSYAISYYSSPTRYRQTISNAQFNPRITVTSGCYTSTSGAYPSTVDATYTHQLIDCIIEEMYMERYLVRAGGYLYTVADGALSALTGTEISARVFQTYGVDEIPDGSLLVGLTDPEVLFWQDSQDNLPDLSLTVIGAPPLPQIITSDPVDLAHESISAIDHVMTNASEDVRFSVSFNGGATWLAHDGSNWFQTTETEPGMLASTMNAITTAQWAEIATLTSCQVRAWLPTVTSYVDSVVFHYINP